MEHLEQLVLLSSEFGFRLDAGQLEPLGAYAEWLEREALEAGGIGPNERNQLLERHVADALTWLQPIDTAPDSLLDIGAGTNEIRRMLIGRELMGMME